MKKKSPMLSIIRRKDSRYSFIGMVFSEEFEEIKKKGCDSHSEALTKMKEHGYELFTGSSGDQIVFTGKEMRDYGALS